MASNKENLDFVLDQIFELGEISYRKMMGEYILYYKDKIIGGIYDNRLLVKPVEAAVSLFSSVSYAIPYDGAKSMLLVEDVDNKELLVELFKAVYKDLPKQKKRK